MLEEFLSRNLNLNGCQTKDKVLKITCILNTCQFDNAIEYTGMHNSYVNLNENWHLKYKKAYITIDKASHNVQNIHNCISFWNLGFGFESSPLPNKARLQHFDATKHLWFSSTTRIDESCGKSSLPQVKVIRI